MVSDRSSSITWPRCGGAFSGKSLCGEKDLDFVLGFPSDRQGWRGWGESNGGSATCPPYRLCRSWGEIARVTVPRNFFQGEGVIEKVGGTMLSVLRVHLPSDIPIVGCELTPYVLLRRPDKNLTTEDVPESAPIEGHFLRYKW